MECHRADLPLPDLPLPDLAPPPRRDIHRCWPAGVSSTVAPGTTPAHSFWDQSVQMTMIIAPLLLMATSLSLHAGLAPMAACTGSTDPGEVLRGFDPPAMTWGRGHRGVDLAARTGDVVRAMAAGTVLFAGAIAGKPVVTVSTTGDMRFTYEPVAARVSAGDVVKAGDVLGTVALSGGHCGGTAGCVHIGLRDDAAYFDPLQAGCRHVLKPWDGLTRK